MLECKTVVKTVACVANAKRGGGVKGEGRKTLTLSPQSPSLFPFLPIPYPFRRLLHKL